MTIHPHPTNPMADAGDSAPESTKVDFAAARHPGANSFAGPLADHAGSVSEENGLPSGWTWTTVEGLAEVIGGVTKGRDLTGRTTTMLPYLRVANVQRGFLDLAEIKTIEVPDEETERYLLRDGDVVLTEGGDADKLGRAALWKNEVERCIHQNHIFRVRLTDQNMPPQWLVYYANSEQGRAYFLEAAKQTVNLASINLTQLRTCPVPVAPVAEQQRIVAAIEQQFSRLDAGVAALRRVQAALKRYRAAVLKAAVEGKLTEAWRAEHPDTEAASASLARILAERRARWGADLRAKGKDPAKAQYEEPAAPDMTDLLELPDGWCWATLEQVAHLQRGRFSVRPRNDPRYYGGPNPFIQIGDLPADGGDIKTYKQSLNDAGLEVSREFSPDTVVVSIAASIGATGILTFRSCFPDSLVGITCGAAAVPKYIEMAIRVQRRALQRQSYASGGQPNINLPVLERVVVSLPPLAEQEQIVAEVERRLSVVSELEATVEANLKRAERMRQSILQQAFSGQLVPQDPDDEPASALLERVRKVRMSAPTFASTLSPEGTVYKAGKRGGAALVGQLTRMWPL